MTIYFDLDGTILDVSERYYQIYSHILSKNGCDIVSKETYWDAKRKRISEEEILGYTNATRLVEIYHARRSELIESNEYLAYDSIHLGFKAVVSYLKKKKYPLVLVTLRKSRENLLQQLKQLGIDKYFNVVLSSGLDENPRWKIKYNLIKKHQNKTPESFNVIVSDTENDIKAGIELGFKTVSVCNGIRNREFMNSANGDYLCASVSELINLDIFK